MADSHQAPLQLALLAAAEAQWDGVPGPMGRNLQLLRQDFERQHRQEQARQLAEPRSCWETLAQPFEPDISKVRLDALFAPLRHELPALIERARSAASR